MRFVYLYLGPSINGLVTDGNTKLFCRGFILELFQSILRKKKTIEGYLKKNLMTI